MVKKINKCRTLYGVSLALLPILFQYATFIPSFTIGDLFYLLTLVLMLCSTWPVRWKRSIGVVILYVILLTTMCLLSNSLLRPTTSLRYIVYLFGIMYLPNLEGCGERIGKVFDVVGKLSVILLIIQYFALQLLGITVPGVLTFLPLTDTSLSDYGEALNSAGRCMSFFAEPSHFAIYAILYLFFLLFKTSSLNRPSLLWALITSAAIIMSASFTGVLCMIVVWGLKVLNLFKSRKLSFSHMILIVVGLSALVWIVLSTTAGSYITNQDVYERQSMGRFSGFQYIYNMKMGSWNYFFGHGMNDVVEIEYLSGWPRLFYYYGLIGSLLYVLCIVLCAKWKTPSLHLLIIIAVLMIGTEMNFGSFFMPYMMFVFLFRNDFLTNVTIRNK